MTEVMGHPPKPEELDPSEELTSEIVNDIEKMLGAILGDHDPLALRRELFERIHRGINLAYESGQQDAADMFELLTDNTSNKRSK